MSILAATLTSASLWPDGVARAADATTAQAAEREAEAFFETHIRPLLVDNCYGCHSEEAGESAGDFRLDDSVATRRGGARGPAVVPGDPDASLLIQAVEYASSDLQMPPEGQLEPEQIQLLRQWIAAGAHDPRTPSGASADGEAMEDAPASNPREHWAFQLPLPAEAPPTWHETSRDVVDAVVATRLAEHGMAPAPEADRRTLIRRLSYDLTGLPPTAAQIEAFVADESPDAYERLVDGMLAAPEFGERWARHWMDVARYADTVGYALGGQERRLRGSERYRDWLIRTFNEDLPYDQMIRYQLAADVLDPDGGEGHLDAMGFLSVGRKYLSRHDILDDQIDVVTRGLLGMTVACARCHDHKFDPIPTTDYYALFGVFNSSQHKEDENSQWPLRVTDKEDPGDAFVLVRGQPGNRGPQVPRRFLEVLEDESPDTFTEGSGRRELAEKIADESNPLTARVYVNRVWGHLVGRPLVDTPSDFGVRTPPPVHPEVLDELAHGFMANGWSTKWLVRRIVLTHIYRQSSVATAEAIAADPENRWLARGSRRRLDFEAMRDSILTASGRLRLEIGGAPVSILENPTPPRRTVYAFIDRQELPGVFRVFDLASPDAHSPERYFTTVPQQALFLMNSPFAHTAAVDVVQHVANRSGAEGVADDEAFVDALYRQILRRDPTPEERQVATAFLATPATETTPAPDPRRAWSYGVAKITSEGVVEQFRPFPHFQNGSYQGGAEFPHPEWTYSQLRADGGHPGPGDDWAVVRRLTVPQGGHVTISGFVQHPSSDGNGVRATIVAAEKVLWRGEIKNSRQPLREVQAQLAPGDVIDLIIDANGSMNNDSFSFAARVQVGGTDDVPAVEYHSRRDFSGPLGASPEHHTLDRRQQLAQVLLMSNEFVFID